MMFVGIAGMVIDGYSKSGEDPGDVVMVIVMTLGGVGFTFGIYKLFGDVEIGRR